MSVQEKMRTKVLMKEAIKHKTMVDKIQKADNHYLLTHKIIIDDLTCNTRKFKSDKLRKRCILIKITTPKQGAVELIKMLDMI